MKFHLSQITIAIFLGLQIYANPLTDQWIHVTGDLPFSMSLPDIPDFPDRSFSVLDYGAAMY